MNLKQHVELTKLLNLIVNNPNKEVISTIFLSIVVLNAKESKVYIALHIRELRILKNYKNYFTTKYHSKSKNMHDISQPVPPA